MDFSRLHTYAPPQCAPENTGYTYALSSSYSSEALDFETAHRLDPVFDSPRMSRRSLRLATTTYGPGGGPAGGPGAASLRDRADRTAKQRRGAGTLAAGGNHAARQVTAGLGSGVQGSACVPPPVLDESLIQEQTQVDHFWGLDDDGDLKGGAKAVTQGNGDAAADAARSNGYTCRACTLLSAGKTPPAHTTSRVHSRDRTQRRKAAAGILWWLGSGWYQLVTLISWLNVFFLTRCLRNACKFLILLIPLLLLLGAGLCAWGQGGLLSLLPAFSWTHTLRTLRVDEPPGALSPGAAAPPQPPQGAAEAPPGHWMREVERQVASLSGQCQSRDTKLRELTASLQTLRAQVDQLDDGGAGVASLVRSVVGQHLKDLGAGTLPGAQADAAARGHEQELRLARLEDALGRLAAESEAIQKELEQTRLRTASGAEQERRLLSTVSQLERELGRLQAELAAWQPLKARCEEAHAVREHVDAQVRETVRLLFADGRQDGSLDQLLQGLASRFVSKDDLQALLRELELRVLRNITHHVSVTRQAPTADAVLSAVREQGAAGITEAQAHVIVNNALKLYSQDKTGMVDFALESGGGSVLSTRCSETYETRTALISLFGIPLWYFSQSPRVVIQPDIYPGNCWAFRGSQGYLVVRLSMEVRPTSFALEHIPKTLSPTGNITSAPRDFSVYGLENEYQEEGQLLGQFVFDQDGESLQTFPVPKRPERAFQIVELRISSNWGHPEYTCLYRFRVHGEPAQ
ncbi:SUN domain-containing protein 1 isoform X3 [Pteronotus mesoamericanus]|uniref:SUN domain-containing protein 1 isoform X3 n=1 Tax=Pteronotus mesoamericanus TaxID=1884717 RepID=UPI0023EDF039|nr:SUN domain-containing protein 1 isoform X3 [Pteronotus parnellii mesoamericanus]